MHKVNPKEKQDSSLIGRKCFIRLNRKFYQENKSWIDEWIADIRKPGFENSHQKFEWNCGAEEHPNLYTKIVQFRPSGIRVKRPTYLQHLYLLRPKFQLSLGLSLPMENKVDI